MAFRKALPITAGRKGSRRQRARRPETGRHSMGKMQKRLMKIAAGALSVILTAGLFLSPVVSAKAFAQEIPAGKAADIVTLGGRTTGVQVETPDGLFLMEGDDGLYYFHLEEYGEAIPYVMLGIYRISEEDFFYEFDEMMQESYPDLELISGPEEITAGDQQFQELIYEYTVSGYTIEDRRLYKEVNGVTYMFASKEVPELDLYVGDLLYEIAGSMKTTGTQTAPPDDGKKKEDVGKSDRADSETPLLDYEPEGIPETAEYRIQRVYDDLTGAEVARCFAPKGYLAVNSVNWLGSGMDTPMQVTLSALSPKQDIAFIYTSALTFRDMGEDTEEGEFDESLLGRTYRMRDASEFCDFYADLLLKSSGYDLDLTLVEEKLPDEEEQEILDSMIEDAESEATFRYMASRTSADDLDISFSAAEKLYSSEFENYPGQKEEYYIIISTLVMQETAQVTTHGRDKTTEEVRKWSPVETYYAMFPADQFKEIYPVYRAFCANSGISDEFAYERGELARDLADMAAEGTLEDADIEEIVYKIAEEGLEYAAYTDMNEWAQYQFEGNDYYTATDDLIRISSVYDHVYNSEDGAAVVTAGRPVNKRNLEELSPSNGWRW